MALIDLLRLLTVIGTISCADEGGAKLVVIAGSDVVLQCSLGTEQNIKPAMFVWVKDGQQNVFWYNAGHHSNNGREGQDKQFKGRVFHFPDELINGNASIIIKKTRLSDSGNYTCNFPFIPRLTFLVDLLVGSTAKPQVMILNFTEDQVLLQCEVHGAFPTPQIELIDSDGNVLPAEEKVEDSDDLGYPPALTIQTSVTQTGSFRCVITQQELNRVTEVYIHALIPSDISKKIWIAAIVGAIVGASAVLLATVLILCCKTRRRAMEKRRDNDVASLESACLSEKRDNDVASLDSGAPSLGSACHSEELQKRREDTEPDEPDEEEKLPLHITPFQSVCCESRPQVVVL